jgi:hypothetical protein
MNVGNNLRVPARAGHRQRKIERQRRRDCDRSPALLHAGRSRPAGEATQLDDADQVSPRRPFQPAAFWTFDGVIRVVVATICRRISL